MKKIVIISNLYPPFERGGAEKIVLQQAKAIQELGCKVFIITTHSHFRAQRDVSQNLIIYRFRPINIFYYLNDYRYSWPIRLIWRIIDTCNIFSTIRILRILFHERPNIVISHNMVGIGILPLYFIKYFTGKHIHVLHDVQLIKPNGLLKEQSGLNIFDRVYAAITRFLCKNIDVCISPSKALLSLYAKLGFFKNTKNLVLKNPNMFNIEKTHHHINKNVIRLLFIGQLEDHKGILLLIQTFIELNLDNITLEVIGNGTLYKRIKQIVNRNNNIIFHGHVKHSEVPNYIKKSDFMIVPSQCFENSPTVIYESFSYGVPVIARDIGGISELVTDNETGFLFNDFSELLVIMKKITCISDSNYQKLRESCYKISSENTIEQYRENIAQIIME